MNGNLKKYYVKKLLEADEIVRGAFGINKEADAYPEALVAVFNKIAMPIDQLKIIPR
jgi:hypothetical protein